MCELHVAVQNWIRSQFSSLDAAQPARIRAAGFRGAALSVRSGSKARVASCVCRHPLAIGIHGEWVQVPDSWVLTPNHAAPFRA
jgi:hypothetical protein